MWEDTDMDDAVTLADGSVAGMVPMQIDDGENRWKTWYRTRNLLALTHLCFPGCSNHDGYEIANVEALPVAAAALGISTVVCTM